MSAVGGYLRFALLVAAEWFRRFSFLSGVPVGAPPPGNAPSKKCVRDRRRRFFTTATTAESWKRLSRFGASRERRRVPAVPLPVLRKTRSSPGS